MKKNKFRSHNLGVKLDIYSKVLPHLFSRIQLKGKKVSYYSVFATLHGKLSNHYIIDRLIENKCCGANNHTLNYCVYYLALSIYDYFFHPIPFSTSTKQLSSSFAQFLGRSRHSSFTHAEK